MKALSVMQPWASLLASGRKTVELRSWDTRHRGPLLVCAGKRFDPRGAHHEAGPRGVALAVVDLVTTRPATMADAGAAGVPPELLAKLLAAGPLFAWEVSSPHPVEPFAVTGSLGLFSVALP